MRFATPLLLALSLIAGAAWAQAIDSRLAGKISLQMSDTTLSELLAKATEQSGVSLRADPKKDAWHVRERRVYVFAKEMPVSDLQNALKKLLGYSWKRAEDPKTGSADVLYQSEVDKARENKQRQFTEENKALWANACKQRISDLRELLSTPLDQLKASDPDTYKQLTRSPGTLASVRYLTKLSNQALDGLIAGVPCQAGFAELPQDVQADLKATMAPMRMLIADDAGAPRTVELQEKLDGASLHLGLLRPESGLPDRVQCRYSVSFSTNGASMATGGDFELPTVPKPAPAGANPASAARPGATPAPDWEPAGPPQLYSDKKPPKDPALLAKVALKPEELPKSVDDLLKLLGKLTALPVLCERYDAIELQSPGISAGERPLYQLLNAAARSIGRTWTKQENALLLKDPDWAVKRAWDVPKEWVDYLVARAKAGMTFDDLATLASFTDEQLSHTLSAEKKLNGIPARITGQERALLRFYHSLTAAQKREVWSARGLSTRNLKTSQIDLATKVIAGDMIGTEQDPATYLENATLTATTKTESKQVTVTLRGGRSSMSQTIQLPSASAN